MVACEQAHLVCYSREYLGGGGAICEPARRMGPILLSGEWSEPARKSWLCCQATGANNTLGEPARRLLKWKLKVITLCYCLFCNDLQHLLSFGYDFPSVSSIRNLSERDKRLLKLIGIQSAVNCHDCVGRSIRYLI